MLRNKFHLAQKNVFFLVRLETSIYPRSTIFVVVVSCVLFLFQCADFPC